MNGKDTTHQDTPASGASKEEVLQAFLDFLGTGTLQDMPRDVASRMKAAAGDETVDIDAPIEGPIAL